MKESIQTPSSKPNEIVSPPSPDTNHLRRTILSYKYEVDRLVSSYEVLSAEYQRVEGELRKLVEQHNRMVTSRLWRYARKVLMLANRIRGRGAYADTLRKIEPRRFVPHTPIQKMPCLPSLPELAYDAKAMVGEKTWVGTRFLSFYHSNELHRILARQSIGEQKIFVQSPIIDWFVPLYQRPQHMALAMARQGYLVFYITANTLGDRAFGFHEVERNVFITNQPVHLMVNDALISFYSTVPTLLSWQGDKIQKVRARGNKLLYEYIDHIDPEISCDTTDRLAKQFSIIDDDHVDLVLASATALRNEISAKVASAPVVYVPNGVDNSFYRDIVDADQRATVPPAMREVVATGNPVVGYFGALAPWLWYPVLNELARMRRDLSFVYLGPDYLDGSASLDDQLNVYKLGAIDYALLPYHAQHFDVAIIPFKPGDIARTTSPLKLFEYFALGKPVVVTDGMPECQQFDEVLVAASAAEYSRKIDQALRLAGDAGFVQRCRQRADENSWDVRARTLAEAHAGLTPKHLEAGVA